MADIYGFKQDFPPISESPETRQQHHSRSCNDNESNDSHAENKTELLIMTIEIGQGRKDTIHVFEGDEPQDLARAFCSKHNLSPSIVLPLTQNIIANIEQVLTERSEIIQAGKENKKLPLNEVQSTKNNKPSTLSNEKKHQTPVGNYFSEPSKPSTKASNYQEDLKTSNKENMGSAENWASGRDIEVGGTNQLSGSKSQGSLKNSAYLRARTPESNSRRPNAGKLPNEFQYLEEHMNRLFEQENQTIDKQQIQRIMDKPLIGSKDGHMNSELTFAPQINQISRDIVENKYQHKNLSVYDRLHHQAMRKQITENKLNSSHISQRSSNSRISSASSRNPGVTMYEKGLQKTEEKKKRLSLMVKEKIETEDRECSFKPEINPISLEIANSKSRNESHEDYLINAGKFVKEKHDRIRNAKQLQEIEHLPFKPAINPISEKIMEEKHLMTHGGNEDHFEKLYNDHRVRLAQQDMLAKIIPHEECTFKPVTNNVATKSIENSSFELRNQRLLEKIEFASKLKEQRSQENLFDQETGQPFFKPVICRPPKSSRNSHYPVWEHLYQHRQEIESNRRGLLEQEQKIMQANMARSTEKSNEMIEMRKIKRLEELFRLFDSDGDGFISPSNIDISEVPTEILEIFAPLLCEMEEMGHTLSLEEFVEGSERLIRCLPIPLKDQFLFSRKIQDGGTTPAGCTFQPQLNKKSLQLASKKNAPSGLYERAMENKRVLEEKIRNEKEKKEVDQLKECSFKPLFVAQYNPSLYKSPSLEGPYFGGVNIL